MAAIIHVALPSIRLWSLSYQDMCLSTLSDTQQMDKCISWLRKIPASPVLNK